MGRYLIRRTLFMILVLFIVSLFTFIIFMKLPAGDPARRLAGSRATTPQELAAIRQSIGLDEPLLVQYGRFAKGLIPWPGLFLNKQVYFSWANNVPVSEEIFGRLPVHRHAGSRRGDRVPDGRGSRSASSPPSSGGRSVDRAGMVFALIGVSAPVFWLGVPDALLLLVQVSWAAGDRFPAGEAI